MKRPFPASRSGSCQEKSPLAPNSGGIRCLRSSRCGRRGRVPLLALLFIITGAAHAAPVTVTDDIGQQITLTHLPQRVVSLAPSVTEIAFAVGGGRKLIADTTQCDYPQAAKSLPHVDGITPPLETLIALHPDLIIVSDQTFTRAKAALWSACFHAPIFVTAATSYQGVEHDVSQIGALIGSETATRQTLNQMQEALSRVRRKHQGPAPRVFYVVWDQPLMTAGKGSFIGDLIQDAGGVNVAGSVTPSYPTYSPERLISDDPDVILTGARGNTPHPAVIPSLSSLNLRAVRDKRAWAIPDDWIVRPGPRLALGLPLIARLLYPEAYNK